MTTANNTQPQTIEIDLTPYDIAIEGDHTVIKDCAGSILANLEKPERCDWTEFYGGWIGNDFVAITYQDGDCAFETHDVDAVVDWIDAHFHAIAEIGYECLEKLD